LIDLSVIRLKWWFLIVVYWEEDLRSNVAFLLVLLLSGASVAVFDVEPFVRGSAIIRVPQDYPTIKAAISAAAAGDTIVVSEGVYADGQINIGKSLTLEANGTVIVDGLHMGHVFYVWANYVTIRGFIIRNSNSSGYGDCGIFLDSSDGSLIEGNIITDNEFGIRGDSAFSNVISNNIIANNSWLGISLYGSFENLIVGNRVVNNSIIGIHVYWLGSKNAIIDNFVANNSVGIFQGYGAGESTITRNTVLGNEEGISADTTSSHNKVFHNNFINNTYQTSCMDSVWDDGYPSGGNYWSDYTGVDFYSGSYQNESGSDGLGDTAYTTYTYLRDNYPLMKPFPWAAHDIGITMLAPSKPIVREGYDLNISLAVFNYGNMTESFNVTVYANTAAIATFTNVIVESKNCTIITFTWNTTGFAKGKYTLSAYTSSVPSETDTTDNTFTGETVCITILCDVNANGYVGIDDIFIIGSAFGGEPGHPRWNPDLDLNKDNYIGIDDIWITASHFGEEYP